MAKVAVRSRDQARGTAMFSGPADPIHLHVHSLASDEGLTLGPSANDCAVFVWRGAVRAGDVELPAGSSAIVGRGQALALTCTEAAEVLCFSGTGPEGDAPGVVRLLPADRVPRLAAVPGGNGVTGALHAASDWPGSTVWLHENHLPGNVAPIPGQAALGVHSHTEDEIIFVTSGAMRLGQKLVGPGTAIAIAANTLYSFGNGPDGLGFVNFRSAMPGDIRFVHRPSMSETGYWAERVAPPHYILAGESPA